MRFVIAIALKYRRYGMLLDDLVGEGSVGLMLALAKFDASRELRFITYASHWVRAYMLGYILRSWSLVGTGSGPLRSKVFFRLRRERAKITATIDDPEEAEKMLAARLGTTPERVAMLARRVEARDMSLHVPAGRGENGDMEATMQDMLASEVAPQDERYSDAERAREVTGRVRGALRSLDPRERRIVEARSLADEDDVATLAEIGVEMGVVRERVRQLEVRAHKKLRRSLRRAGPLLVG